MCPLRLAFCCHGNVTKHPVGELLRFFISFNTFLNFVTCGFPIHILIILVKAFHNFTWTLDSKLISTRVKINRIFICCWQYYLSCFEWNLNLLQLFVTQLVWPFVCLKQNWDTVPKHTLMFSYPASRVSFIFSIWQDPETSWGLSYIPFLDLMHFAFNFTYSETQGGLSERNEVNIAAKSVRTKVYKMSKKNVVNICSHRFRRL